MIGDLAVRNYGRSSANNLLVGEVLDLAIALPCCDAAVHESGVHEPDVHHHPVFSS
jgi:hypothetical protein